MSGPSRARRALAAATTTLAAVTLAIGCPSGGGAAKEAGASEPAAEEEPMFGPKKVSEARQLRKVDGKRIVLIGTYRKIMTDMGKQGRPDEQFVGYVGVELAGKRSDIDPRAWDGEPPMVQIGLEKRSDDEVARFEGKRVRVEGRFVLDPNSLESDQGAAMMDADPALVDVGEIKAAE